MTGIEGKRKKYTCPCGFASYDLTEFLKHPFMEYVNKLGPEVAERSKEGNQDVASSEAPDEDGA